MEDVKLIGFFPSPFSQRIIWALKLKGVSYQYIEEDIFNKTNLLLHHNPVHKKVPVLIHGGKSIAESMVVLEYIDETWPQNPLLPSDPYERSVVRFWATFIADKVLPMTKFFRCVGEEQEKAINDSIEILKTIEEYGLKGKIFFGGDEIGLADIALGWIAHTLVAMEEAVGNIKFVHEDTFPQLHAWVENFTGIPVIKDNLPDHDLVLEYFKGRREVFIQSHQICNHRYKFEK